MTSYWQRVIRADGRTLNIVQHRGHLSYCVLNYRALVIDTETPGYPLGRISEIASVLRASSILLANIENMDVLEIRQSLG